MTPSGRRRLGRVLVALGLLGLVVLVMRGVHLVRRPGVERPSAEAFARVDRVTIVRDVWGVPHIQGDTDADAAFGLAYAHAEDDYPTIQAALAAARGKLGLLLPSEDALSNDYYASLVQVDRQVTEQYESLDPGTRAVLEAYAEGLDVYAFEHPDEADGRVLPFTGRDIAAGFVHKLPYLVGFVDALKQVVTGGVKAVGDRTARLDVGPVGEQEPSFPGSNAHAVHRARSTDDVTRLNVNSHQPWEGPVTWYEAHVHSNEGWNAIGGLFPGAPFILHGHNEHLGWAHTVNAPDLVDVYRLEMKPDGALEYRFDGKWVALEVTSAELSLDLWVADVSIARPVYRSVHGPVMKTDEGWFAIRYAGIDGVIRAPEQWFRMNKAKTFAEWREAMAINALPMFNTVYADRDAIAYFYNAKLPHRAPGYDYRAVLPGDDPRPLWSTYFRFDELPRVIDPPAGFVQACNSSPFSATVGDGNPRPQDFPVEASIETKVTNRALRSLALLGGERPISSEAFLAMKWDRSYAKDSEVATKLLAPLLGYAPRDDSETRALQLLHQWDREMSEESAAASIAVLAIRPLFYEVDVDADGMLTQDPVLAFQRSVAFLMEHYGKVEVPLGELQRLRRGTVDLPLGGGPDVMNAAYTRKSGGHLVGFQGDSYVLELEIAADGVRSRSIHQYGSSCRPGSKHYADQAPLFVKRELRDSLYRPEDLAKNVERSYHPGR